MMQTPALVLLLAAGVHAADPGTPHPHQGVLRAYSGPPPLITLSADERARLAAGGVVKRQLNYGDGGRGVAVQDIHAPPDVIWGRILDFPAYPRMVDNVQECEIYSRSGHEIKARFVIGALMMSIEYYIDHEVHVDEGWLTWTLDYGRESELDDSVGFWRVEPLPDRPGYTRLFYSVEVKPSGWVPGPIEDYLTDSGLTKATAWVKRESEAAAGR
jgi:ribosome-associated toxin RatA of RatAB toxin-antitoxin module